MSKSSADAWNSGAEGFAPWLLDQEGQMMPAMPILGSEPKVNRLAPKETPT
jgi:hypothetical protein